MCLLGTVAMILIYCAACGYFDDVPIAKTKWNVENIAVVALVWVAMLLTWWSFPFAWLRGMIYDPAPTAFCILMWIGGMAAGTIKSADSVYGRKR